MIARMTEQEAISIAENKARDLNIPWSREDVAATYRRLWPFPGRWMIVARVKNCGAVVRIQVRDSTGFAMPKDVLYPAGGLE